MSAPATFSDHKPLAAQREAPLSKSQIKRLAELLTLIHCALDGGATFDWSDSERRPYMKLLHRAGVELVAKTTIKLRGHTLKRDAKPVGTACFGLPRRPPFLRTDLYVLGVQTLPGAPKRKSSATAAKRVG